MGAARKRTDLIGPIPEGLRTFKSDGAYGAEQLPCGAYLVWAESVGDQLVVVFHHAHPGRKTYVGTLTTAHTFAEGLQAIPPLERRDIPRYIKIKSRRVDDDYTRANRVAIWFAEQTVATLRTTTPENEAWLRTQLAALDGGAR